MKALLALAALAYFLVLTFFHDTVSTAYARVFNAHGRAAMESALHLVSVGAGLVLGAAYLWRAVINRTPPLLLALGWVLALAGVAAADHALIVTNVERVHYFQYAGLAFLCCLFMEDGFYVLLLCTILGMLDELAQYAMFPAYTRYLDFNDFVLNYLGAFMGVLLHRGFMRPRIESRAFSMDMERFTHWLAWVLAGVCLGFAALGRVAARVVLENPSSAWVDANGTMKFALSLVPEGDFWTVTDYGRVYHVLQWCEGLALVAALLLVGLVYFRALDKRWYSWGRVP